MFRWISMLGLSAFLLSGFVTQAEAKIASTDQTSQFKYSGKIPKMIPTKLSLDKLLPKTQKKLATSHKSACGSETCDVIIDDGGGVPPGLRIAGLILNIALPMAIGSWIAGDMFGAYVGGGAQVLGFILFLAGIISTTATSAGTSLLVLGSLLMLGGYILPIVTVMLFRKSRYYRRRRRRRYYRRYNRRRRRRHYRRYQAPSGIDHTGPLARGFKQRASWNSTAFAF